MNITEENVKIAALYVTLKDIVLRDVKKINFVNTNKLNLQPRIRQIKQQLRPKHLNTEEQKSIYTICEDFDNAFFLEGDYLTYAQPR